MKKSIITVLILFLLIGSCSKRNTTRDYRDFLVEDIIVDESDEVISKIQYYSFEKMFYGDTVEKFIYMANLHKQCKYQLKNTVIIYDLETKQFDTILKNYHSCIRRCYPVTRDSIFYMGAYGDNNLYCITKDSLYTWHIPSELSLHGFGNDFDVIGKLFCDKLFVYDNLFIVQVSPPFDYDNKRYVYDYPLGIFFSIEDGHLRLIAQKGYYPEKELENNFYAATQLNIAYNNKTKDVVFWHPMLNKVRIENLENDEVTEKEIKSRYFKTPENITRDQRNDNQYYRNYHCTNNEFIDLQFDQYRDVYISTLKMPRLEESEDKMTKNLKVACCIQVFDSEFNFKYEFFFPDTVVGYTFPVKIRKDGVYMFKRDFDEDKRKFGKFIFN
ncbi:MAG: hypothetical protein LBQ22_03240 [Bacteroidales bacterium]|jgi:hypothetical protein|nr:hypothetical protein [Bacteroidales bacterium]